MKQAVHDLAFEPERFDVVVTPAPYAEPLVGLVAHGAARRASSAPGRLADRARACSRPAHGAAEDIAGQGVANPASMLLAAALMLGEGLGERASRRDARPVPCSRRARNGARTPDMVTDGVGRDDARVRGRRALRQLPHSLHERRVLSARRSRDDAIERRRRGPPLARGRGRRRRLRAPGRRDPADLRRVRARHDRAPRPRPARAGRRAHGRGLRARVRARRRRDRHLRPGRDEPRHADRRRVDGLDAARLRHRPGAVAPDRHRRLPGVRHHRHHDPDRQALVARPGRRGDPARA